MVIDLLLYVLWLLYFACGTLSGKGGHAILAPHAPWLVDHLRCDTLWSTDYPDVCPWIDMTGSPDQQSLSGMVPPPPASSTNETLQRPVGWGELCTSSCLHRGHHGGKEMVRCLHCAKWMHADCIAKCEEYYPSSWACFSCRQLPCQVTTLTKDMARLVEMVQGLTSSMTSLKDQHERAMAQAEERHQKLASENAELRQRISDLSRQASSDHWRQLKKPHGTALIGSSIIRDIAEEKLVATQCICKRGGVIKDLQEVLDDLPADQPLSRIILVGGGNDCDIEGDDLDVSGITAQYRDLAACAKIKAASVTICSVCPRNKSDVVSQRIESLNAGLKGIASDLEIDYLDNDPIFYLQDGTLNDGYLLPDGVHLSRPATNRLVVNMQLPLRQGVTSAHTDHRRRATDQHPPAHASVAENEDSYNHSFWRKSQQKANRGQRQAPRTDRVQRAARSSDAHSPSARPSSHRPQHTAAAPTTGPHPSNRQPQRPDSQRRRVAPSVSQDTRTYRTPYPPHLMDIPTQPPHTPTRSHAPRGQPTSNLPYVSNPRVKNPSDVPAVPPNTQCQLCLGWGHSAVICRSRDSKCYSCSKHGHLARACPLLSP